MGQKRPQKTRRLKVPKLEVVTSQKEKDRECSAMLTEKETAALFLGDLATGKSSIPSEEQSDMMKPSASPVDTSTQTVPSKNGKKEKKGKNTVAGRSTSSSSSLNKETPVKTVATQAKKLKTTEMIVPLEEGEEDPSVSAEVLRQTAAFLARLTPSRSQKFWALRQVARGEKTHQSIAKETENLSDDDDEEEEEEEEEEVTSSDDLNDERNSGTVTEEEDTESAVKNAKGNKMKRKRGGGGSLFNSNPDFWDD